MHIGKLFDLITDTKKILAHFEGVQTSEQMTSALERLKSTNTITFLENVSAARRSVDGLLDSTLEMNSSGFDEFDADDDGEDADSILDEVDDLDDELGPDAEESISPQVATPKK